MNTARLAAGSLVVLLALAGCSSSTNKASLAGSVSPTTTSSTTSTTLAASTEPNGWLGTTDDRVMYLQWTTSGSSLTGSAQTVSWQGAVPRATAATETATVSGTSQGDSVSLTLTPNGSATWYGSTTLVGTRSSDTLTINIPQQDGSLQTVAFHPAGAADFNLAADQFRGRIAQTNSDVLAADQAAAAAQKAAAAAAARKKYQSDLAAWKALPVCQGDNESRAAEDGYLDYLDCQWPDSHTQVCNPYYPSTTEGLPPAPACPDHWRRPNDPPPQPPTS